MGWLENLFGKKAVEPRLPAGAVVLPNDLVTALTAGGKPLGEAAVAALRAHVKTGAATENQATRVPAPDKAVEVVVAEERTPFWLGKEESDRPRDVDDALRDRLAQRRAEDGDELDEEAEAVQQDGAAKAVESTDEAAATASTTDAIAGAFGSGSPKASDADTPSPEAEVAGASENDQSSNGSIRATGSVKGARPRKPRAKN